MGAWWLKAAVSDNSQKNGKRKISYYVIKSIPAVPPSEQ